MGGSAGGGGAGNAGMTMGTNAGNEGAPQPMGPDSSGGGLAALFANNRPMQGQSLPQIMQPTRPPMAQTPQMPEPNPPTLFNGEEQAPSQGVPGLSKGLQSIFDSKAKSQGFKDGASLNGFMGTLTQEQRNAYNRPDMRGSGGSIMSPTDPVWTQTNPEMMSAMTQWQLKEQFPQLFGGGAVPGQQQAVQQPSAAQQLAQRINSQYQR